MDFLEAYILALLATILGSAITAFSMRDKYKKELADVSAEWKSHCEEIKDSWEEDYKKLSHQIEAVTADKKHAHERMSYWRLKAGSYKQGLLEISNRRYYQIGQAKAPHATVRPHWEIADEYLKGDKANG